jgi:hypothetical protein
MQGAGLVGGRIANGASTAETVLLGLDEHRARREWNVVRGARGARAVEALKGIIPAMADRSSLKGATRREFIATGAAAASAWMIVPRHVLGQGSRRRATS